MTSNCRMELCQYWPGEGCMAGVMPCDADDPGPGLRCPCGALPEEAHREECDQRPDLQGPVW